MTDPLAFQTTTTVINTKTMAFNEITYIDVPRSMQNEWTMACFLNGKARANG